MNNKVKHLAKVDIKQKSEQRFSICSLHTLGTERLEATG